jgi:hypothetical protein
MTTTDGSVNSSPAEHDRIRESAAVAQADGRTKRILDGEKACRFRVRF